MESSADKDDHHLTLENEKQKMAQTFQSIGVQDKFLPQMVRTPMESDSNLLAASPNPKMNINPMNQTSPAGGFFGNSTSPYKSKIKSKINIIDGGRNPYEYAQKIVQDYKAEELNWDEHQELERKFLVTQIPKNGSKIDFKLSPAKQLKSPGGTGFYKEYQDLNTLYRVKK